MKTARQGIIDGGAKGREIFAKCGERWRAMSAEEKEPFERQATKNREAYNAQMKAYNESKESGEAAGSAGSAASASASASAFSACAD